LKIKFFQKRGPIGLNINLAIGLILCALFLLGAFEYPELGTIDFRYRLRGPLKPHPDIILVGITRRCLFELGKFPWPRNLYAQAFDYLKQSGAKVIAMDIMFAEPDATPGADEQFKSALIDFKNCILPVFTPYRFPGISGPANFISVEFLEESIPSLSRSALTQAHINLIADPDGVYRKVPLGIEHKNRVFLALGLETALRAQDLAPGDITWEKNKILLANKEIPLYKSKFAYMNLFDFERFSPNYAFVDVLNKKVPPDELKDKIIIMGQITQGLPNADVLMSPFGAQYGVILQADIVNTFLSGAYIWRMPKFIACIIILILALFLPQILIRLKPVSQVLSLLVCLTALSAGGIYLFSNHGMIVDIIPIATCLLVSFTLSLIGRIKFSDEVILKKDQELDSILETGKLTTEGLESGNTQDIIAATLINALKAKGLVLRWQDKREKELKVISAFGIAQQIIKGPLSNIDANLARETAKSKKPTLLEDIQKDVRFRGTTKETMQSVLCVPLVVKDQTKGVLTLYDKATAEPSGKTSFSEDDLKLLSILSNQASIALENASLVEEINELFLNSIKSLAQAIDAKDPYTHGHSERVTADTMAIAEELNFSELEKRDLMISAILHDVGKIGIKENILQKPAPLTDEEKKTFDEHSSIGAKIMSPIQELEDIIPTIRHHHESYNGKGYPDGLRAGKIPFHSRIIAVADTFDAMTSDRPYRKALSDKIARDEVNKLSGIQFDPKVVEAFNKAYQKAKIHRA